MYYCITYLCLLNFVSPLMSYRLSGESAYRLHMHWLLPHARYIWSSFHFVNIFISFFFLLGIYFNQFALYPLVAWFDSFEFFVGNEIFLHEPENMTMALRWMCVKLLFMCRIYAYHMRWLMHVSACFFSFFFLFIFSLCACCYKLICFISGVTSLCSLM